MNEKTNDLKTKLEIDIDMVKKGIEAEASAIKGGKKPDLCLILELISAFLEAIENWFCSREKEETPQGPDSPPVAP